jgi:squalene cyclase
MPRLVVAVAALVLLASIDRRAEALRLPDEVGGQDEATVVAGGLQASGSSAEAKAVAYLAAEVPKWRREHGCYSCHNNGDAVRALLVAAGRGHEVGAAADDTLAWLATPERWDSNAGRGGSEDLPLGRIQFSSTLLSMVETRRASQDALERAAAMLVSHQREDGSWKLSDSQILGGPTFYGTSLATALANRVLLRVSGDAARVPRTRAAAWLRTAPVETVLDASALVLGLDGDDNPTANAQRGRALDILRRGQGPDGGWGPYVTSPSEPFDTALAVLALVAVRNGPGGDVAEVIRRGRAYLLSVQTDDGSWPETTRPPNGESYAQRISTTAWALQALLASQ